MQLSRMHLSQAERLRWINDGLCLYCGEVSHVVSVCPTCPARAKDQAHHVTEGRWWAILPPPPLTPLASSSRAPSPGPYRLCLSRCSSIPVQTTTLLTIPLWIRLTSPHSPSLHQRRFSLWMADSSPNTHRTAPLSLLLSGNYSEKIQLLVIPSPQSPIVLGLVLSGEGRHGALH